MRETEEIYDLIERYQAGTLEGEELAGFESDLANDPELRATLALVQDVDAVLEDGEAMAFSQTVSEAADSFFADSQAEELQSSTISEESSSRRRFPAWLAVAASVALLAVAGYFILNRGGMNASELFLEHYDLYEAPSAFRGDGNPALGEDSLKTVAYTEAFAAYKKGDFELAIPQFEEILAVYPDEKMVHLYLGLSQLELGAVDESILEFSVLADGGYSPFQQSARWYLALAYLKQDNDQAARKWLDVLAGKKGAYQNPAQKIIEELD